jgi:hypothetical protein
MKMLGNPAELAKELRSFRKAARVLSSDHPRLIIKYPKQWVAIYRGSVTAHSATLDSVLKKLQEKGIPKEQTIVRYIDRNRRTMIL